LLKPERRREGLVIEPHEAEATVTSLGHGARANEGAVAAVEEAQVLEQRIHELGRRWRGLDA